MPRLSPGRLALLVLASLILLPRTGRAEAAAPEKISFETADGVVLRGTWYPSIKEGSKSPAVMFVHKLGADRAHPGWDSLAKALQGNGFSVLSFDLRGCGESTVVKAEFWKEPHNNNRNIEKADPKKGEIDFKQFKASYYPVMVNDLAAAKYALDLKNNGKECNCGDTIIVAAEDGANLASLFIASEWQRRKQMRGPNNFIVYGDPEGKDIAGAIFLSPRPTMGPPGKILRTPMPGWLNANPIIRDKVGFFLLNGGKDLNSAQFSKYLINNVLLASKVGKAKPIFRAEIKDTNLTGADLLKKTLITEEWIVKYCSKQLMEKRAATIWSERKDLGSIPPTVPVNELGCKVP